MSVLQNILFANGLPGIPKNLYYTASGTVYFDEASKSLVISERTQVSFGTYFNYFSLNIWHSHCKVDNLFLRLRGKGEFILTVMNAGLGIHTECLMEKLVVLTASSDEVDVEIPYSGHRHGMVYFTVTAITECQIKSSCFYTRALPVHEVRLGIVITHFNRKQYLLPAIRRIQEQILQNVAYKDHIDLIVVDNSRNVLPEEAMGVTVIPNENYGGSGGFTRGLLYLKDHGYTHCLFMDDDASCEVESIVRTLRLLQYSITPRLAIAGSMIYENHPTILHEKGALYKPLGLEAIHVGMDISVFENLKITDMEKQKADYGAWWHFAFKLSDVRYYPFPFFVKGDDMLFGLVNGFNIITMNGICVFGEDFSYKDGPLPRYLSIRANLALALIYSECSLWVYLLRYCKWILSTCVTYRYASARASSIALQHVIQGPSFWEKHLSFKDISFYLEQVMDKEKMASLSLTKKQVQPVIIVNEKLTKFLAVITLNGFLLPTCFIKKKFVSCPKVHKHFPCEIFRNKNVLYYSKEHETGYIAIYDKGKFYKELFFAFKLAIQFIFKFNQLKKAYKQAAPHLMSEKFWRKLYQLD